MSAAAPLAHGPDQDRPAAVRPWTTTSTGASSRRRLQVALAALWLLDAALQYQPAMFTPRFVTTTLLPAASGNPGVIADPLVSAAHLIAHHVAIWNAVFATVQLLLAAGILWPRTVRAALATSIVWSLAVWWVGEGLGGVLGTGTAFTGAPGAALLYVLLAVLAWPAGAADHPSVATSAPVGRALARGAWLLLWAGSVFFTVQPEARSPNALAHTVAQAAGGGEPGWVRHMDRWLASGLAGHGTEVSLLFAAAFAFVALSVLAPGRAARAGVALAVACGLAIWVAEDFGAIFTGHGTDPNSGLVLVLLAAAYWPRGVQPTPQPRPTARPQGWSAPATPR